ncbi:non-hydrolyzing UDP-N-acetylglucosamine 2-epimerase [Rubeoparvulum massiliense]|uniref:non-hydrolyzing UDP-N-acetylglucosamine 2-epimerase n=1 Tax=Rubeoparvulum massiliense TaxID=1631346 RepID=UPI000975627F|nr:UDP-N-acetylglucosamine 2-epimerase (non-hydrolyzing) [Rubeoparvulum massiliense]
MKAPIKVLSIFGTRPDTIKMAPLIAHLAQYPEEIESRVCVTAQQREMLDQMLDSFQIKPDVDCDIMQPRQSLAEITVNALNALEKVLIDEQPDLVLVHGDTTTSFVAALAAFYHKVPVGHVEAGLRAHNKYSPFPEEMNRQLTGVIADLHFAPTKEAAANLLQEGKAPAQIYVTGNTVIDALKTTVTKDFDHPILHEVGNGRLLLLTAHRRENFGQPMRNIFEAVRQLIQQNPDLHVLYPLHLNPNVREVALEMLADVERVHLVEPMDVLTFHNLQARATLILTDSGGLQEEAPSLGVPVLVLRNTTERPEGVEAGTLKLIGTESERIVAEAERLLHDPKAYEAMAQAANPYGDGQASQRIVEAILHYFGRRSQPPEPFTY